MSGYDSIIDWSDRYLPMRKFDSFMDWVTAMEKHFETNERFPLGHIFDDRDWNNAENRFNEIHEGVAPVEKNITRDFDLQTTLDDILKEIGVKPQVQQEETKDYGLAELKNFFRRFFDL